MIKYFYIFLFLCLSNLSIYSQSNIDSLAGAKQPEIKEINTLLENEKYDVALLKLNELATTRKFKSFPENIWLNFKKAIIFSEFQEYQKASDLLESALKTLDTKPKNEYNVQRVKLLSELGNNYKNMKRYTTATRYHKKALDIALKEDLPIPATKIYLDIGDIYTELKQIDSALTYLKDGVKYKVTPSTNYSISKMYNNIGIINFKEKNTDTAEVYFKKAYELRKELGNPVEIATSIMNLSSVDYRRKSFETAKKKYDSAYAILENNNTKEALDIKVIILRNLSYTASQMDNFELAFNKLLESNSMKDSLQVLTEEKDKFVANEKFNVVKATKDSEDEETKKLQTQVLFYSTAFAFVALLVFGYIFYRNYRLRQQNKMEHMQSEVQNRILNATIDAKENERKSIAQTLHDSVSALLSSANLHLQATKAQLKDKAPQEITKAQAIVNEASVKIRDLSHELISSILMKFGLAFAVHDLCQKYSNSEISLHSDDNGIKRYDQDFEIKVYNIIEELINNILKHSKASNATIMLAHRENDMLSVRISDDGIGFDPKIAKNKDGLGLSHIEARIRNMRGVFNIVSSENNGTNIFILVPIKAKEEYL